MQGSIALLTLNVVAGGALAIARFVTFAGAYPAAGAGAFGVTRTSAGASGDLTPVDVMGTSVVESGAAITAGALVESDVTGRVITRSAGVILGRALNASSGAGQVVEVALNLNAG